MRIESFVKLILSIGLCLSVGIMGGFSTGKSIETWYAGLKKPYCNPPNWVFGPVWTVMYILMGTALFILLKRGLGGRTTKIALFIFVVQLLLNAIWSPIFFGKQSISGGLITILVMWFFILLTIIWFSKVSKLAAVLLIPYILWVTFAAYLNLMFLILN